MEKTTIPDSRSVANFKLSASKCLIVKKIINNNL